MIVSKYYVDASAPFVFVFGMAYIPVVVKHVAPPFGAVFAIPGL